MNLRGLILAAPLMTLAVLPCPALQAGEYNAVIDIGAPMPQFSDLPATDGTTLSSYTMDDTVLRPSSLL